jgi:hypothetical protein
MISRLTAPRVSYLGAHNYQTSRSEEEVTRRAVAKRRRRPTGALTSPAAQARHNSAVAFTLPLPYLPSDRVTLTVGP